MLGLRKKRNVVDYLCLRQISAIPSSIKFDFKILRRLIESENSLFELIWKTRSQQPILCENGKLYQNNYSLCLTLRGDSGLPSELYRLPKSSQGKRIVDAVLYSGPVYQLVNSEPTCYKPFFLALSSDNWLRSYDNFTGALLQEVYIGNPSRLKYQHCDWETYGKQVVLTSALNVTLTGQTAARAKPRVLATLAVFTVLPLQFVGILEIDRDVFGTNCNHVNVADGMLVIGTGTTASGAIRLYNFSQILQESICEKVILGQPNALLQGAKAGTYPAGLPMNCRLKRIPPALFDVDCFDHIVHFGGFPWCYVTSPPRSQGVFHVRVLANNSVVQNGHVYFPTTHFEPDTVVFHDDNSGRLLYKSAHAVRQFALECDSNNKVALMEKYSLSFEGSRSTASIAMVQDTSGRRYGSRRACHNRTFVVLCSKSVLSEDYDEDMDLFAILGFDPCDPHNEGRVMLFDNITGDKIKTVELGMKLDEMNDYSLHTEIDTIVITEKTESKIFVCYVFSLRRKSTGNIKRLITKPKKKHKNND